MSQNREKLFSDFKAPTTQEWLDKIQVDLKGADFQKKLVWRTNEGFNVQPFYSREDLLKLKTPDALPGEFPFVRGNKKDNNTWFVRQNISCDDAKEANAKALDILNKGVDSLGFNIPSEKVSADYIDTLLKDICAECVELNFNTCKCKSLELADLLIAYFNKKGYDPAKLRGSIDFDPIEKILIKGKDTTKLINVASQLVSKLEAFPEFRCVTVNAVSLNNSGAYIVQELGYALAWGNEYLQQLTDAGIKAGTAARKIKFNMGISANYFMEIAKFRAARMLWANIVKKYQPECDCTCEMVVNASTSEYNMTIFDSYVNLLRSQTESMSAALAGVDSIVVTPFDLPYEQPTEFSERIARNQQLLLKEECHFDKIVDVSAGSYYIEELTNSIANEAWKIFLSVEEEGGFLEAAKKGIIQDAINATNKKRHESVGKRKEFLLGTNQFPNFTEKSDGKEPNSSACCCSHDSAPFKKIESSRLASDFETLRMQTEKSGKTPTVFMLTIGKLAWRQARAQFSSNFLACAGYQIIDNLGFDTVEEGVDAALEAKADIVVLCSSDEEYATYAIPAFQYLNGRALYIVAGAPECMEELKAAGIENFVHVRCDVLETLKGYNAKLGIK
jgi:methylmalonyl-CoA mutase